MITYYNHPHMTAVPTRLLLDTNLSAEAKLTGALLYTFEDGGLSAQELANALTLPPEKVSVGYMEGKIFFSRPLFFSRKLSVEK